MNATPLRPTIEQAESDAARLSSLQEAVHGFAGIFWALDMLFVHKAADDIAKPEDRENGIVSLIVAGQVLTEKLTKQF